MNAFLTAARRDSVAWSTRLTCAAVSALAGLFALRRIDDFDTWWHLAAGRWIAAHARVPRHDVLSHTVSEHAWIDVQWLFDVALYALHQAGGPSLLIAAQAIAFAAACAVAARSCLAFVGPAVTLALCLVAVVVAEARFLVRPEMVTFVLLAIELHVLLTMRDDQGARLWVLPPLLVLWANTHALFAVGVLTAFAFSAGALTARAGLLFPGWRAASDPGPLATRRLLVSAALCAAATLVNPYFLNGALFPLELVSRLSGSGPFQVIGEFSPPFAGHFVNASLRTFRVFFVASVVLLAVAAVLGARSATGKSTDDAGDPGTGDGGAPPGFDVGAALAFCLFASLALTARRNTGLFVLACTPIVASWIALVRSRAPRLALRADTMLARSMRRAATPALCAVYCALAGLVATNRYYEADGASKEFGLGVFEANFPMRAARFAEEHGLPPNLYNDLAAGGYLTWNAPVPGGVFIDGRLEVYDEEFFAEYMRALGDHARWQLAADRFGVATAIVFHRWPNRDALVDGLLRNPLFALVYYDEAAVVFVRRAGHAEAIARATSAFPSWDARTRQRLFSAPRPGRAPVELATGLDAYARVLLTLGLAKPALEASTRQLAIGGLNDAHEAAVRLRVARLLAHGGDRDGALREVRAALALAPRDEEALALLKNLGG